MTSKILPNANCKKTLFKKPINSTCSNNENNKNLLNMCSSVANFTNFNLKNSKKKDKGLENKNVFSEKTLNSSGMLYF